MAVENSGVGDGGSVLESPTSSNNNNKNKMKFLCSHGGRIVPRAGDGQLRYIGGETRAVVVPYDISFSELKQKLAIISHGDTVLKYELIPGDLEALVSVRNDEDLRHMVDEYNRHAGTTGTPKLRAFLFPSTPIVLDNQTTPLDPNTRYFDAVNGILRPIRLPKIWRSPSASACSSPRSPQSSISDFRPANREILLQNDRYSNGRNGRVHKVHSSPALSSFNQPPMSLSPPLQLNNQKFYHYQPQQRFHRLGYLSPTGSQPERLYSVRSVGRSDPSKFQEMSSSNKYFPVSVGERGSIQ